MGMSASQARMLFVTSRQSDLEFQAQSISNSKIRLSQESEEVAEKYSNALDKKNLMLQTGWDASAGTATYTRTTAAMLVEYSATSLSAQRLLRDSNDRVCVSEEFAAAYSSSDDLDDFLDNVGADDSNYEYYTNVYNAVSESGGIVLSNEEMNSADWLYSQLSSGNLYLQKWNSSLSVTEEDGSTTTGGFESISWKSGDSSLQEITDDGDVAKAEAEYDAEMAKIHTKEKKYDLQLKNIETEHSAIQAEVESIKKVIEKNIETSFKIFSS